MIAETIPIFQGVWLLYKDKPSYVQEHLKLSSIELEACLKIFEILQALPEKKNRNLREFESEKLVEGIKGEGEDDT